MYRGYKGPFAPGPYGSRVNLPIPLGTLPFVFVRSHAWPKQDQEQFLSAVRAPVAQQVPRGTYFVPYAGRLHPTQAMCGGMQALSTSANNLAQLQRAAIHKRVAGMPLTEQEARAVLSTRMPRTQNWQEIKRERARAVGAPVLTARQLPPYVIMPPAVMKMRAALTQSGVGFMNEGNIVSRQRRVWDLTGSQVRGVLRKV